MRQSHSQCHSICDAFTGPIQDDNQAPSPSPLATPKQNRKTFTVKLNTITPKRHQSPFGLRVDPRTLCKLSRQFQIHIDPNDFDKIPKYMRGRDSLGKPKRN